MVGTEVGHQRTLMRASANPMQNSSLADQILLGGSLTVEQIPSIKVSGRAHVFRIKRLGVYHFHFPPPPPVCVCVCVCVCRGI